MLSLIPLRLIVGEGIDNSPKRVYAAFRRMQFNKHTSAYPCVSMSDERSDTVGTEERTRGD